MFGVWWMGNKFCQKLIPNFKCLKFGWTNQLLSCYDTAFEQNGGHSQHLCPNSENRDWACH